MLGAVDKADKCPCPDSRELNELARVVDHAIHGNHYGEWFRVLNYCDDSGPTPKCGELFGSVASIDDNRKRIDALARALGYRWQHSGKTIQTTEIAEGWVKAK